jgi:FSR family fosmidomycin resistance protein-like MFS transporter
LFVVVLLISGLRIWAQSAITTFAPKFYLELHLPASESGGIVAIYMAGTALGGVLGSSLADRWSYQRTVAASLALSILPFWLFPTARGPAAYALAALAGIFNGGPHSILVTMAQRALPGRAGFASGLILGLTFALGALGTLLTGWFADQTGLPLALQLNAAISLAAMLLSLLLVAGRHAAQSAPAHSAD